MTKRPHKPTELINVRTTRIALGEEIKSAQMQPSEPPAVRSDSVPTKPPVSQSVANQPETSRLNKLPLPLIFLGAILVCVSLFRVYRVTTPSSSDSSGSSELSQMLMEDDRRRLSGSLWENDEPSFFGKLIKKLCLGYATSEGCSDQPLHPFRKVYEERGKLLEFPKEPSKKVVEQEIEIKSKNLLK